MSAKVKVKGCTHVSSVRAKQTSKRDTDAPAGPEKKGGTTMSEVHLPHQHSDEGTMRELQESVETIGSFQTVADVFKQLSDSSRVRIFWLLCHCEECVIDLSAMVGMSSPAVSHHLRQLRESGLLVSRRVGKEVYYRASDSEQAQLLHRMIERTMEISCPEEESKAAAAAPHLPPLDAEVYEGGGTSEQIETIRAAIAGSRNEIEKREEAKAGAVRRRMEKEGGITQQTARVRKITDEREALGREIARLTEQKEQKDAEYEQTVAKLWEEYELTLSAAQELCVPFESGAELRRQVSEVRGKIKALGNVNVSAIEEYAEVSQRYEFLRAQVGDVETSKAELQKLIAGLSDEMRAMFSESFAAINRNFGRIFAELFGGGTARLYLEDEADVLGSGISIEVAPPGKIIRNLSALSGGEQALVAISIYFAIFGVNPAPFCVLDEIEAALDDVNVTRFAQYLRRISSETQFIVITHRRGTMEEADVLYGVTMQEDGVSKVLKLDLEHVDASLVS